MEKEEELEGNALIAEHVGLKECPIMKEVDVERAAQGKNAGDPMYIIDDGLISNLQYHFSADWLLPIISKLLAESMSCSHVGAPGYLAGKPKEWYFSMFDDQRNAVDSFGDTLQEAMFRCLVKHLKKKK